MKRLILIVVLFCVAAGCGQSRPGIKLLSYKELCEVYELELRRALRTDNAISELKALRRPNELAKAQLADKMELSYEIDRRLTIISKLREKAWEREKP